jgi:hypothetical protein
MLFDHRKYSADEKQLAQLLYPYRQIDGLLNSPMKLSDQRLGDFIRG